MLRNMDWILHFTLFFLSKSLVQGGRLAVLNSPSSVSLRQISSLKFHDVVKLYGSILGFSKDGQDGSKLIDIKSYPEMVITVTVDEFIDFNDSLVQYKLIEDSHIEGLPEMIRTQAADIYGDDEFRLREIDLASSGLEDKDVPQSPSAPIDERLSLALIGKELNALKTEASEILKRKEENNGRINTLWYSLEGLKSVDSEFGKTSREAEEVRRSITNSIRYLQRALDKAYGDKFILIVISSGYENSHYLVRRETAEEGTDKFAHLNLSKEYSEDYAAIFNIIFWTSVALIWVIVAAAVFIATMDPGRDSIIYRMTSQRIKKDQ